MADLYTRNGEPLRLRGDDVFDRSGQHVGRRRGNKIYGTNGRYQGTIVGDRVAYRSTDSANLGPSIASRAGIAGAGTANRVGSAMIGDEPTWDK